MPDSFELAAGVADFESAGGNTSWLEAIPYWAGDSVVSAAAGLYNTGVALGNSVGADWEEANTRDWIQGAWGDQAAQFYDRNEELVDFTGFVVGSLIPGGAASKGVQLLRAGKVINSFKVLGLENGFAGKYVAQATKILQEDSAFAALNPYKIRAITGAIADEAIDNAAIGMAVLATNNQAAAINKEDLGYWGSFAENFNDFINPVSSVFGIGVTGVGSLFRSTSAISAINKAAMREQLKLNPSLIYNDLAGVNAAAGDKYLSLYEQIGIKEQALAQMRASGGAPGNIATLESTIARAKNEADGHLAALFPGQDSDTVQNFMKFLNDLPDDEARAKYVSGLTKVQKPRALGADKGEVMPKIQQALDRAGEQDLGLRPGNMGQFEATDNSIQLVSPARFEKIASRPEFGLGGEDLAFATLLHEIGHSRSWDFYATGKETFGRKIERFPEVTNGIRKMDKESLDAYLPQSGLKQSTQKYMREFSDELINLSRMNEGRGGLWKELDDLEVLYKNGLLTDEKHINYYSKQRKYLYDASELMADAYAVLNRADAAGTKQLLKKYPKVANQFKKNNVLFEQYGIQKVGLDLVTGEASAFAVARQVSDLGAMKLINKDKTLSFANGSRTVDLGTEWNPLKLSMEDSDAHFAGWEMLGRKGGTAALGEVTEDNLPKLQAYYNAAKREFDALPPEKAASYEVKVLDTEHDVEQSLTLPQLQARITDLKYNWSQALYGNLKTRGESRSIQEIARWLNVDEKFVANRSNHEMANVYGRVDPTKARFLEMGYSKQAPLTDKDALSMQATRKRVEQNQIQSTRINGNVLESLVSGDFAKQILSLKDGSVPTSTVTTVSSQRGFFKSANADYGTFGSVAQATGRLVNLMKKHIAEAVGAEANVAFHGVVTNPEAKSELNVLIASKLRGEHRFTVRDMGDPIEMQIMRDLGLESNAVQGTSRVVVNKQLLDDYATLVRKAQDGKVPQEQLDKLKQTYGDNATLYIKNTETLKALEWIKNRNASMVQSKSRQYAASGRTLNWDPDVIYIPPPNPDQFTHVAFVKSEVPEGLGKATETNLIFAQNPAELQSKIKILRENFPSAEVLTKDELIAYKKARGEYDASKMLQEKRFDTQLRSKGLLNSQLPRNDTLEFENVVNYFTQMETSVMRDAVGGIFSQEIAELGSMARRQEAVDASKVQGLSRIFRRGETTNPYQQTIDTLLDRNNKTGWEAFSALSEALDSGFSQTVGKTAALFKKATTDDDYKRINQYLEEQGLQPAYKSASELASVSQYVDKQMLSKIVNKGNAIVATTQLSLDFLQSIANAVSLPILMVPEMMNLRAGVNSGEIQKLFSVVNPATGEAVPSNMKVLSKAVRNYARTLMGAEGTEQLVKQYTDMGIIGKDLEYARQAMSETVFPSEIFHGNDRNVVGKALQIMNDKVAGAANVLKKVTLGEASERAVRFIAADVGRQLAEAAGLSGGEAATVINTFVNRVHGNYTAAQKPAAFQGVIGQAIGLFQTYQFNVMQQAFRNWGEGNKKAFAMMMGLQGTIFGMRGLPGFKAFNEQVAGRENDGNDAIARIYRSMPEGWGDWLVYGLASNTMGVDIFNRGDMNPRNNLLIPTTLDEVPLVSITSNVAKNFMSTARNLSAAGLNGQVVMEGLAHNGLNRPLAGIATQALGYRTTSQGKLLMAAKDDAVWSNAFANIVGGKPIDDAIVLDTLYRKVQYDANRMQKINDLGAGMRAAVRSGKQVDPTETLDAYVKAGGRSENYNKWMTTLIKDANESQINDIVLKHQDPRNKFYMNMLSGNRSIDYVRQQPMADTTEEESSQ